MADTITAFIKQDLQARLSAGWTERLTLAALAQHYQVSLTPVRLAVEELLAAGVLCKEANGRLTVNAAALPGLAAEVPLRPAVSAYAEAALRVEIIQMSLHGTTDSLREEATAARYGVGRTVLRQVLHRLAGQGLIEHLPRRGWRVRPFDESEMSAYLQVRECLELKALDLARPKLVPADLQRMLSANRRAPQPRLDNDLHRYLLEKADNRYLREFFERHGPYYATLFDYAAPETNVVRRMARQHRVILRALLAQDWQAARRALVQHIRAQGPIVRLLLRQAGQV